MKTTRLFLMIATLVALACHPVLAGKTVMKNGDWLSISSPELVQAEIDGKVESICLPKLEFQEAVDGIEVLKRMRSELKKQGAVFHLYQDGLGMPIKKGFMLFASDVYLKDLKMTYSAAMRAWGYKFKVSAKASCDDPSYIAKVQNGSAMYRDLADDPLKRSGPSGDGKLMTAEAFFKAAHTVLPPGLLPPETRKMKDEIDKRVRALKNRPYEAEIFRVDVVRWASGIMGTLTANGLISAASAEGQQVTFQLPLPAEANWLTPALAAQLASQPCEFVIHRTIQGRDAMSSGAYLLADLYFTDLAENWEEWLTRNSLHLASRTLTPDLATVPVTLDTVGTDATWRALRAPVLALVSLADPSLASGQKEMIRLQSPDVRLKQFPAFAKKINQAYQGQSVHLTLLVCRDGKPYLEFDQKRAARILFRDQKKTLLMLFREEKAAEKGR